MAGKPKFGGKARTERIMFNVTPELLNDFKAVAFLNQQSMVERVVTLMEFRQSARFSKKNNRE